MTEHDHAEHVEKVREIIRSTRIALLSHVDDHGRIVAKPMTTQEVDFDGTVRFLAERHSDQVQGLLRRPAVNVAYSGDGAWVSLAGTARVVDDVAKIKELWNTFNAAWLECGPENPDNVIVEVDAETAEYWDAPGGSKVTQVANLVKSVATGRRVQGDSAVVDL